MYLTGAFNLSSNTRLQLEKGATVLGSTKGEDWPLIVVAEVLPQFRVDRDCGRRFDCSVKHQAL
eukprot:16429346-Heterocapsa_arctica.AAC.1